MESNKRRQVAREALLRSFLVKRRGRGLCFVLPLSLRLGLVDNLLVQVVLFFFVAAVPAVAFAAAAAGSFHLD